jgi:hypothetical protein
MTYTEILLSIHAQRSEELLEAQRVRRLVNERRAAKARAHTGADRSRT